MSRRSPSVSRTPPMKDFRDGPTTSGLPSSVNASISFMRRRFCSNVLANPRPGSTAIRSGSIRSEGLPGRTHHQRSAQLGERVDLLHEEEVLLERLGESKAGIDGDPFGVDPIGRTSGTDPPPAVCPAR